MSPARPIEGRYRAASTRGGAQWAAWVLASVALSGCAIPLNGSRQDLLTSPSRHALPHGSVAADVRGALLLDLRLDPQVAESGCGAHAVASLLEYWSRTGRAGPARPPAGADLYVQQPPRAPQGYSLSELVDMLERQGLSALAVRTTWDALRQELEEGRPAIARVGLEPGDLQRRSLTVADTSPLRRIERWAAGVARSWAGREEGPIEHYWVVAGFTASQVLVLDPVLGFRRVEASHFDRVFQRGGHLAVVSGGWR